MKTHSDIEIPVFQNLGTNRWYYHFNHSLQIDDDGLVSYSADTVVMAGHPIKENVESALVSPVTDKGEPDDVYNIADALYNDLSLIISYTDDVYRSVTRQDVEGLEWMSNEVVKLGQKRTFLDTEYECLQSHITQKGWDPSIVPALWKKVSVGISEWVQPTGAHDAYQIGYKVHYPTLEDQVWISKINANVTVPDGDEPYNRYWEPFN